MRIFFTFILCMFSLHAMKPLEPFPYEGLVNDVKLEILRHVVNERLPKDIWQVHCRGAILRRFLHTNKKYYNNVDFTKNVVRMATADPSHEIILLAEIATPAAEKLLKDIKKINPSRITEKESYAFFWHYSKFFIRTFLNLGMNANIQSSYQNCTLLFHFARNRKFLEYLLKRGAHINYLVPTYHEGETLLLGAIRYFGEYDLPYDMKERPEWIKWLLDHGADPRVRGTDGLSALDWCHLRYRLLDQRTIDLLYAKADELALLQIDL